MSRIMGQLLPSLPQCIQRRAFEVFTASADASPSDATSSDATCHKISSTRKQGCIESGECALEEHPPPRRDSIPRSTICVNGRREENLGPTSMAWRDGTSRAYSGRMKRVQPFRMLSGSRRFVRIQASGMKVTDSNFPSIAPWNSRGQPSSLLHAIFSLIKFGSDAGGNGVSLPVTTDRLRRSGSL